MYPEFQKTPHRREGRSVPQVPKTQLEWAVHSPDMQRMAGAVPRLIARRLHAGQHPLLEPGLQFFLFFSHGEQSYRKLPGETRLVLESM